MGLKLFFSAILVAGFLGLAATQASSFLPQDEKDAAKKSQDDMAKLRATATPGDAHKALAKLEGAWDQKVVQLGTSMTGSGTVRYHTILGGRFVVGETSATMKSGSSDGQLTEPWEGFQVLGYDNATKQYQTTYCDTMGTGIFMANGTADASGKIFTYEAQMKDALTPQGRPFKVVVNCESDDQHTIELWDAKDGKALVKKCVITETRQK